MLLIAGGSPSRMRGKELHVGILLCGIGITPAYAGKRRREDGVTFRLEDHPRICGEKPLSLRWNCSSLGSPPHMRGKAREARNIWRLRWITPAYAGKRHDELGRRLEGQDHPRVCGEKVVPLVWMTCDIGSPPRMRGKATACAATMCHCGITPAYAGKSRPG